MSGDNLKPGEWEFVNDYTAIYIHVPHKECEFGLVRIPIHLGEQTEDPNMWGWNGDKEKPTLTPSINVIGIWHGYLREGKLVEA